jgi:hypothetical protein
LALPGKPPKPMGIVTQCNYLRKEIRLLHKTLEFFPKKATTVKSFVRDSNNDGDDEEPVTL